MIARLALLTMFYISYKEYLMMNIAHKKLMGQGVER
jgi:hypothetical protein